MTEDDKSTQEIEIEAIGVEVSSEPIELYKVFKLANLVGGGGEAKYIISEGYVAVNGELETRKRRKMYHGDVFEFNQEFYVVICDADNSEYERTVNDSVTEEVRHEVAKRQVKPEKADSKKANSSNKKNKIGRSDIDFF